MPEITTISIAAGVICSMIAEPANKALYRGSLSTYRRLTGPGDPPINEHLERGIVAAFFTASRRVLERFEKEQGSSQISVKLREGAKTACAFCRSQEARLATSEVDEFPPLLTEQWRDILEQGLSSYDDTDDDREFDRELRDHLEEAAINFWQHHVPSWADGISPKALRAFQHDKHGLWARIQDCLWETLKKPDSAFRVVHDTIMLRDIQQATDGLFAAFVTGMDETVRKLEQRFDRVDEDNAKTHEMLEKLLASVTEDGSLQKAKALGMEKEILALARRAAEDVATWEEAVAQLRALVERSIEMKEGEALTPNTSAAVNELIDRIQNYQSQGEFEEAQAQSDRAIKLYKDDEAARREAADADLTRLLTASLNAAYLNTDAKTVATREIEIIQLQDNDPVTVFHAVRAKQVEYHEKGERFGAPIDLDIAEEVARFCVDLAPDPYSRALAQHDLGIILARQGERGQGGALAAAETAFRAALEVYTKEAYPEEWAGLQICLGVVLWRQGERGRDGALEAAEVAYRAALEVFAKEAYPVQWAMTQMNLGNVLSTLGERGQDGALEEAATAYRSALEVYTKEAYPVDWARTQMNLGNVHWNLGSSRHEGALEAAEVAYRAALEVRTKEAYPVDWARTVECLGWLNKTRWEQDGGDEHRLAAIGQFEQALDIHEKIGDQFRIDVVTDLLDELRAG